MVTLDPTQFRVTNTFPYATISLLNIDEKSTDQFELETANKNKYIFKTAHRSHLLCQLYECIEKDSLDSPVKSLLKSEGLFEAQRVLKLVAINCHDQAYLTHFFFRYARTTSDSTVLFEFVPMA